MNFIIYVLLFTLYPFIVQSQIKLEKVTPKISNLWGIATINKDEILVTQRSGNLYRLNVFNKNTNTILKRYLIITFILYSLL